MKRLLLIFLMLIATCTAFGAGFVVAQQRGARGVATEPRGRGAEVSEKSSYSHTRRRNACHERGAVRNKRRSRRARHDLYIRCWPRHRATDVRGTSSRKQRHPEDRATLHHPPSLRSYARDSGNALPRPRCDQTVRRLWTSGTQEHDDSHRGGMAGG